MSKHLPFLTIKQTNKFRFQNHQGPSECPYKELSFTNLINYDIQLKDTTSVKSNLINWSRKKWIFLREHIRKLENSGVVALHTLLVFLWFNHLRKTPCCDFLSQTQSVSVNMYRFLYSTICYNSHKLKSKFEISKTLYFGFDSFLSLFYGN